MCWMSRKLRDVLQIPAFLCRQTDLLVAAGESGKAVNIKKGQWLAPEDMRHPVTKVRQSGGTSIAVTERGTAIRPMEGGSSTCAAFMLMSEVCGCPAIFDATHSVQLPGRGGGPRVLARPSGGEPRFAGTLARAAVAAGADGVFHRKRIQTRLPPLSDGANMLPLDDLEISRSVSPRRTDRRPRRR